MRDKVIAPQSVLHRIGGASIDMPEKNPVVEIRDKQNHLIGYFTVEKKEGNLLCGNFSPGPAFPSVENRFQGFEEAVNSQTLAVVDEFDRAIESLGLHLCHTWPLSLPL